MYGFVARRVRSSYYGRLNEQFLSTFIPSGIARIFPRAGEYSRVRAVRTLNEGKILRYYSENIMYPSVTEIRFWNTQQAGNIWNESLGDFIIFN